MGGLSLNFESYPIIPIKAGVAIKKREKLRHGHFESQGKKEIVFPYNLPENAC